MTSRKVKHARALAKREEFLTTIKQGNTDHLNKVRDRRTEVEKQKKRDLQERKKETSRRLAQKNLASKKSE